MIKHPDHKYIEALKNNDSQLIEEIYSRYSAKIRRMVLKNNGTETDAADLFQDVLIELHRKATQQQFTLTCPFDAFLHLMCRNRWINKLQKQKGQPVTLTDEEGFTFNDDVFENYETLLIREKRKDLIEEKLAQLGEDCRNLLSYSWSGKPLQEVAALLNFSYAYVRKRKSECLAKLIVLVKEAPDFSTLKW